MPAKIWKTILTPLILSICFPLQTFALDAIRPLDPAETWLIPINPKPISQRSPQPDQNPTKSDLPMALIKCSEDSDVVIHPATHSVIVGTGDLLIEAKQSVNVECELGSLHLAPGTVTYVRCGNGLLRIDNMVATKGNAVTAAVGGNSFSINCGQELFIANDFARLTQSAQADGIGRRLPALFHLTDGRMLLRTDFAPSSLLKQTRLVLTTMHSSDPAERNLFARIMKTAAALSVATAGHGGFMLVAPDIQNGNAGQCSSSVVSRLSPKV